jgi:Domain of unknown function (DUF6438)
MASRRRWAASGVPAGVPARVLGRLATAGVLAACVVAAATTPRRALGQAAHRSKAPAVAPAPSAPPIITLERTGCHGQCAEYKLSFYDDGEVVYEGKANVSKAGRWHATVTKDILSDLLTEFQRTGYAGLSDKYPAGLTETSTATTSLRSGDKVKTVTHEVGSPFPPASLIALEDRIDASVQSVEWSR